MRRRKQRDTYSKVRSKAITRREMIKRGGLDERKLLLDKARYRKCALGGKPLQQEATRAERPPNSI